MKEKIYTDIICKGFCRYYKEGREEIHCNGYVLLRSNFTPYELKIMLNLFKPKKEIKKEIPDRDERLIDLLCKGCDFFIDGCDYADNISVTPCGGFLIVNLFLEHPFEP